MRILHLVHRAWPYHGGAERYVLEHALAGVRRGHESVICTTDAWDMSWLVSRNGRNLPWHEDRHGGVEIRRFPVIHPPLQGLLRGSLRRILPCGPDRFYYPNPFLVGLRGWLERQPPFDLVHANAMPFMLYEGWRYARKHGAILATVPHANYGERFRSADALRYFDGCQPRIFSESSFTVAQSLFERELLEGLGVPRERILVLGSGIDPTELDRADPEAGRARFGLSGPVVLFMTAHSLDRGTSHAVEACRLLFARGHRFTLVLAGPLLPDAERFLAIAPEKADPCGSIVLTGLVGREERIDLLAAADLVILPSRLDCFGIVLLEAWAAGKPVIGCWSGAMPDLVEDGVNGFLVSWGDVPALADRIERLLGNRCLTVDMAGRGRAHVWSERTWDRVTDTFYRRAAVCAAAGEKHR
jgi:glycosyltransferase involved in cell wall biosynthesis